MFVPVLPVEVPVLFTRSADIGVEFFALVATMSLMLLDQLPVEFVNNDSRMLPSVSWKNNRLSPFGNAITANEVSFCNPSGRDVAGAAGGGDDEGLWILSAKKTQDLVEIWYHIRS